MANFDADIKYRTQQAKLCGVASEQVAIALAFATLRLLPACTMEATELANYFVMPHFKKSSGRKKMGRPRAIATRPRMRDSLPVAHVPCVRALRGSMGRLGVAAAFQRRHGRIVTAAQVIASNGPPCALLHPRRSPFLVGRAHGSRSC